MEQLVNIPIVGPVARVILSCLPCGRQTIGSRKVRLGTQFAEGGFSTVFRCTDVDSGAEYALKKMIASEPEQISNITNEIRVHQQFEHPNLLELLDCEKVENQDTKQTTFYLLFPLYEKGTIGDVIVRMRNVGKIFSEEHALQLFAQVLAGVAVMHEQNIAHHDIKPENVLLTGENRAVLMDFGSACRANYNTNDRKAANELKDWAAEHCTMPYRAPELFEPRNYRKVTATSDVWSLGCMLFAMAYGMSPFEAQLSSSGENLQYVECSYLRVLNKVVFPSPARYSKAFVALILSMLVHEPEQRPTVAELVKTVSTMLAKLGLVEVIVNKQIHT